MMTSQDLHERLQADPSTHLIDLRSESAFQASHLPGAKHAYLHEAAFSGAIAELVPEKSAPVVLYGESADHSAEFALMKLEKAGYTKVLTFAGGVEEWKNSGFELEDSAPASTSEAQGSDALDGTYSIHLEKSLVEWRGRNIGSKHEGTLGIKGGSMTFEKDRLTELEVVVDMTRLDVTDLSGEAAKGLIGHLSNEDFFETDRFPEATFTSIAVTDREQVEPGTPELLVKGMMTIKGEDKPVCFVATSGRDFHGLYNARALLEFDRTDWKVLYGSGKFFKNLGFHLVMDLIDIEVTLRVDPMAKTN